MLKEKNSTSEYSQNEGNRNLRVKVFKTLEDIKKDNIKENFTSINNVRDFLQDTNHSVCSEYGKPKNFKSLLNRDDNLPKDSNQLERRIIKQQYLVNNNLFDPADYFGGLEVSNLEDNFTDQRLFDDMLFYLPTEMEEVHHEHENYLKERSKKNENNIPKKVESSYKLPSHNKTPSMAKVEMPKNIPKVYPETTKENKEIQFTEGTCYILNSHVKAKAESDKDSVQSNSTKLRSKFNTSSQKTKLNSSTNSSQELKSVTSGLFKRKITSESNSNKENKEDQESRNKLSSSTAKSAGLQDSKGFRKGFDASVNKRSLNTSAQNKTEKSFQQSSINNPNRSFASINKSLSTIQTSKLEFPSKTAVANSEDLPIKKKINKRVMSVSKPKVENQSLIRSKTKSIDRNKEMKGGASRNRNVPNNFSSFNGTLTTEEEADYMFKSYNALTRPRTATNVQNEESSYVLKGILSPKVNKSLITKPTLNKTQKKPEKVAEQKAQPSNPNPLKFLNDLLNKRKISYSSSDHLRMPKKPTFLGKKNESPTSQIGTKPAKTTLKTDNFETKVSGHIKKGHSQSIANYVSPTASQKNLI